MIEDAWAPPPDDAWALTADPALAPAPAEVVIGFEHGLPVSLDGEELPLAELVARAEREARGAYGIGRIDMIENRSVGIKSRELYEAPAALVLIDAHRALEDLTLTKAELRTKRQLEETLDEARLRGPLVQPAPRRRSTRSWTRRRRRSPARCGSRCGRASAIVNGRRSPNALYAETLASYGAGETFPHEAAEGYIRIVVARDRAARGARAGEGGRLTLWSGRVARRSRRRSGTSCAREDAELLPYDCEATAQHARRLHAAGPAARDEELERGRRAAATIAGDGRGRVDADEDVHSAIERQLGEVGRKIHAGRSRNDQVAAAFRLYVVDACAEAREGIERLARAVLDLAEAEADTLMPGLHAPPARRSRSRSATTCSRGSRCSTATAAASPPPPGRRSRARSAPARSPARRSTSRPAARDAELARRGRRPRLRARLPLRRAVLFTHLSRIGEELVPLGDARSSASCACPRRRRRARR